MENKEREAFEAEFSKIKSDITFWLHTWDEEMQGYNHPVMCWFWYMWQAKKQATPEGFVLVPVKEIKNWFLDESENIYREDPDWLCDIPIGEVVEVEHRVSYELEQDPVFAAIQWDEINGDVGYYETFDTKEEAEKVAAHCKAMIEAQEHSHD
ncbi:hypothetical protein EXU29_12150 [Acinetobacter wuhouensis]|uniref:hypothetical protein n=1 Tax=Acinetobacter wuhouensis TaxID=1879050 RepID=UPI00102386B5|nr:hypothetical protein [Acinetobacter wuhouensis]RZG71871.1 hypothetical protein EXU29_12150 [Acinetobacter wuhouensis]